MWIRLLHSTFERSQGRSSIRKQLQSSETQLHTVERIDNTTLVSYGNKAGKTF